jgi:short-subunit dehydrogenase
MTTETATLITGATDGIGLALAKLLQARGERPFLLGRRSLSQLDDPLFTPGTYVQADLSRPDCARRVLDFLAERQVTKLDRLIHNAGIGYYGQTAEQSPAQSANSIDQLIDVNLLAPIRLTHALLPHLKRAQGQVSFVSSVVAIMPGPNYAVYTATKAALEGFARSLRQELLGQVAVQIIRPGATRTGMHAKMGLETRVMDWQRFPPAETIAPTILRQIERGGPAVTVGLGNRLLYGVGYYFPRLVTWGMKRRTHQTQQQLRTTQYALRHKVCAITGAADGIGRALALRYAQAGYTIVGIDLDAERSATTKQMIEAGGGTAVFFQADLSQTDGLTQLAKQLADHAPLDVFIHNAGINAVGHFAQLDLARQEKVLDLNLRAPLQLTAVLLNQNQLAADGQLVFLSSLSRYVSYPGAAVYAATKDGLAAYGRSLDVALPQSVLTVFPGPTRTAHARRYSPDNSREETRMAPERLADLIFEAAENGRSALIPGLQNQLFAQLGHYWPGLMDWAMRKLILEKLGAE